MRFPVLMLMSSVVVATVSPANATGLVCAPNEAVNSRFVKYAFRDNGNRMVFLCRKNVSTDMIFSEQNAKKGLEPDDCSDFQVIKKLDDNKTTGKKTLYAVATMPDSNGKENFTFFDTFIYDDKTGLYSEICTSAQEKIFEYHGHCELDDSIK